MFQPINSWIGSHADQKVVIYVGNELNFCGRERLSSWTPCFLCRVWRQGNSVIRVLFLTTQTRAANPERVNLSTFLGHFTLFDSPCCPEARVLQEHVLSNRNLDLFRGNSNTLTVGTSGVGARCLCVYMCVCVCVRRGECKDKKGWFRKQSARKGGTPFNSVSQNQLQQLPWRREWSFVPFGAPEAACGLNNQCFPPLPNCVRILKITLAGSCCESLVTLTVVLVGERGEHCTSWGLVCVAEVDGWFTQKATNCFKSGFLQPSNILSR